ncbi:MAG: cytochrome c family protein, partial [Calditrichia bacterium]
MILRYAYIFLLFLSQLGFTQLSPGDLHKSHAHLEGLKNCQKCHGVGQRITASQCLECHQILKEEIDQKKGLHSRPGYNECQKCHVEHHGRDFDLIWWEKGQENFNHELTGFTLLCKHKNLKCNQCHQEKNMADKSKFTSQGKDLNRTCLGLSQDCLNCHRDEHRGQLSSTCLNCHNMDGWKPAP